MTGGKLGPSLSDVIKAYDDAWNRKDIPAVLRLHTTDTVFQNHATGELAQGKPAVEKMLLRLFKVFPEITFTFRKIHIREDLVVQEWTSTAIHSRPIVHGRTIYKPTGATLSWTGVDVMPMRDELVLRKDTYMDRASLLRQIGVTSI